MTTQTISARVDSEVLAQAKKIAKMNGLSLSSIINVKLREFTQNRELKLVDEDDDDLKTYDMFDRPVPMEEFLDHLRESV